MVFSPLWACAVQRRFCEREWRAMKSLLTSPAAQNNCPIVIRYQNLGQACRFRLWYTAFRAACNASLRFLFFAINCQSKALYFGILLSTAEKAQGLYLCPIVKYDRRRFDVCYHAEIKSTLCRTYKLIYSTRPVFNVCPRLNSNIEESQIVALFRERCKFMFWR